MPKGTEIRPRNTKGKRTQEKDAVLIPLVLALLSVPCAV